MKLAQSKKGKKHWYMLRIDTEEAVKIIKSLACQLLNQSANVERAEFCTEDKGEYFSIAVSDAYEFGGWKKRIRDLEEALWAEIDLSEGVKGADMSVVRKNSRRVLGQEEV